MNDYRFLYYDEGAGAAREIIIPAKNIWEAIEIIKAAYPSYKSKFPVTKIEEEV